MSAVDRWDAATVPEAAAPVSAVDRWDAVTPPSPKPNASSLGSDVENFFAGVGKAATDTARGSKQLLDAPAVWLEKKFPGLSQWSQSTLGMPSAAASAAQTDATVNETRRLDAPLMETKAGLGGDIAGNIAAVLLPAGVAKAAGSTLGTIALNPKSYKAAAAVGAAQGAVQPVAEGESRALNTGVGTVAGVAGNAAVNAIGRAAQPVKAMVSAAHDKAVQVLEAAGVPLDAAQRTGSTFLNKVRSSFSDNPFTAGAQAEYSAEQKAAYNRAILRTIGEDATAATPEVMGAAEKRIDGVFKDVLDRNRVHVNDSMLSRVGEIQKKANEEEKKPVSAIANRILDGIGEDGSVSGQAAYNVKKDLDRLASSADTTLAHHARQLRSAVMDAIQGSLNDTDRAAFAEARGQFANMKKIEGAIDRTGSGDISPAKLANVFYEKRNRSISIYGRGPQELYDLAQSGNMLIPDRTGNSGTAARLVMQLGPALLAGGAEGYHASGSENAYERAALAAGSVYAAPKLAQMFMNSPGTAKYLQSGIRGSMTPLRDLLLMGQENAAVGGALRRTPESERLTRSASERP